MITKEKLLSAVDEAVFLGMFKLFCEKNSNAEAKRRIRNILSRSTDKRAAVSAIFLYEMKVSLTEGECNRMLLLVEAFLSKNQYRKYITKTEKMEMLNRQNYRCRFCKREIDLSAHADHIIPFKLVGDELENNLQMLCERCNKAKKESIDYEVRNLLHIVEETVK